MRRPFWGKAGAASGGEGEQQEREEKKVLEEGRLGSSA